MKLDAHVHTRYSGRTSLYPLSLTMRESYNRPGRVYRLAKARGMDLVAITDHDCIAGALTLADRPDVLVGCAVTATFTRDGVRVHLNVLDITERQFLEIDRRRHDVAALLPYLKAAGIFTVLNHVASRVGALAGLPLVLVPLAMAVGHFVLEARFNQTLLVDLVARPSARRLPPATRLFDEVSA